MSDCIDLLDFDDTYDDYVDEAIEHDRKQTYFNSQPKICQKCRWMDWYYEFGCTQQVYPIEDKCYMFANHKLFKPLFWFNQFDIHYQLWKVKIWLCEKVINKKRNE